MKTSGAEGDTRHVALEDEPGHGLDVRPVLQLAWRTLPYLRPVLRELRPVVPVLLVVLVLIVPVTMLGTDLFLTRMLSGEPLTPFQAGLLRFDPESFVDVERLSAAARRALRDRLLVSLVVLTLLSTPIAAWLIYVFIKLQQRINQILRVQMVERVQAMSLRFHSEQKIGDSVYRTYQDSAMLTNLMAMLVRPIGPIFNIVTGLAIGLLFDWRLPLLLLLLYAASYALARRYTAGLRHGFKDARERNSALTSRVQEALAGVRVIKAFGAEKMEEERFDAASRAAFDSAFDARARRIGERSGLLRSGNLPFFAKWPARIAPGTEVSAPVHHFDMYATAAAAAAAPLPADRKIDGVDLVPFATGEARGVPHDALFWRSGASQSALVRGWKLNVSDPPGRAWLFDLAADPNEQRDLSAERPEKLAELQAALAAHNAEQAEPAWPSLISVPINLDKDLTQPDAPDDEYIYWSN